MRLRAFHVIGVLAGCGTGVLAGCVAGVSAGCLTGGPGTVGLPARASIPRLKAWPRACEVAVGFSYTSRVGPLVHLTDTASECRLAQPLIRHVRG